MEKTDKVSIKAKALDIAAGLVSDPARIVVVAKEIEAYLLGEGAEVLKKDGVTLRKTAIKLQDCALWLETDDEKTVDAVNEYMTLLLTGCYLVCPSAF